MEPNEFTLYGFTYPSMAHYIVIQRSAKRGSDFKKYFNMSVEELPEIKQFNHKMLEEGLEAMLPQGSQRWKYYVSMHHVLGIGTTRMRLRFGDEMRGRNLYGKAVQRVLNKRRRFK